MSATIVRRLAIAAQGYTGRYRRATTAEVERTIRRLSCVQLDSISTVERSHRLALVARIGDYPHEAVSRLLSKGRIFEYWAHEACLLPIELWPLCRPAMENGGRTWYGAVEKTHPHLAEEILGEIRERGPLASRHFEGSTEGGMWNWKPAKATLERLWNRGELVVRERQGFQRVYDLAERVIPRELLEAPAPSEAERLRTLAEQAVRARGALTASGIVEHWRLRGGAARVAPAIEELVAEGRLRRLKVDDGGAAVFVAARTDLDVPAPSAAALLSPFDNLLWDRPFARRIFDFDHLIEVYKPAPQRRYGYYVLPFLWRDRIVGRADLKSERKEGRLVVRAFHRESGVRASAALDDALDGALDAARPVRRARGGAALKVGVEEARRIAIRAQALDGNATGVLDTVRRLGRLQIDPISTVAPPQRLVLWSRLGSGFDPAELDRLLWEERQLFEWNAFIWPIEFMPVIRGRMARRNRGKYAWERRSREFMAENRKFRRHILQELEANGPLLSRELADHSVGRWGGADGWWGNRNVAVMLEILHGLGEVAVVGRRQNQRVWDLAERWYPETEVLSEAETERELEELRFRTAGVRLTKDGEWETHPEAQDGPVPDRATLLSPFDRLIHDRDRAEALFGFRYRLEMYVPKAKREYGYYVLPLLAGDRLVGRAEPRFDRKTGTLELLGAWGDTSRLDEALDDLAAWLGAERIAGTNE